MIEKIYKNIIASYRLQFLTIAILVFTAFYKVLNFSFHANREIGWLIPIIGNDLTIINLMRSHGFINIINYMIYGANPTGWYLTGIIFHILASCVLIIFVNAITKNKTLGFLTGVWFAVSMAWHDTITFGSQESVYAFQLFVFFIGILIFKKFRETGRIIYYILSFILFFILPPLRESGLFFFLILFVYDFLFHILRRGIAKKELFSKFAYLIPFLCIVLFFVFFRSYYGGSPNDYADERVKLANKLIAQGEFVQYIKYGILAFGSYLPPHFIPYPFINFFRTFMLLFFNNEVLKLYFFPVMGYIFYALVIFGIWIKRNSKNFRLFLFALAIITIPTLFYSFAFTTDEPFYLRDYGYDENRWRYVAFFGTSLYLILLFNERYKIKLWRYIINFKGRIITLIFVLNLILNIGLLWQTQDKMYEEMFKSQKLFYSTFLKMFPTYSKDTILYAYPYSYQLGDYLWEWYFLKEFYYKGLSTLRTDWSYGEIEKVLRLIKSEASVLKNIYFIDFDPSKGVIDYTNEAKKIISEQKTVVFNISNRQLEESLLSLPVEHISPAEIPYLAEITMKADLSPITANKQEENKINNEKLETLIAYSKNYDTIINRKILEVCRTRGNMIMFDPSNLTDGNFGNRSVWWADCIPGWFIMDLGKNYDVSGFMLGGIKDDPLLPQIYDYEISGDGKTWKKIMTVKNNMRWEMLDKWPKVYNTRYIKVSVASTQKGSFVMLDEAEPILADAIKIFDLWTSRQELKKDLYSIHSYIMNSGLNEHPSYSFGKFTWKTDLTNIPADQTSFYFPFVIDGEYHTYKIPIYESEYYSLPGQFLKKRIQKIDLDFSNFPGVITIESIKLTPKIPISE